jgi:hemerythrin superfamily protein
MLFIFILKQKAMKIYNAIKQDHDIQRDLCDKISNTSGDTEERRELWKKLKKELEVHAVAEERYFYSPLVDSDEMQEDARHGMAEHHEMDELIEEINKTDMSSPHWLATVKKLIEKVEHHLDDEEKDFFDKAKNLYSEDEAESLAKSYETTMTEYRNSWPDSIPGKDE